MDNKLNFVNIGCGSVYHTDWINVDLVKNNSEILYCNILNGLPFKDSSIEVCYSSHLFEHLSRESGIVFLKECFRVLKSGGILRLVTPDLQTICTEYINILTELQSGNKLKKNDYDWIIIELLDQITREFPGGYMKKFLNNANSYQYEFAKSRIGSEVSNIKNLKVFKSTLIQRIFSKLSTFNFFAEDILIRILTSRTTYDCYRSAVFRNSGEIHKWMYDSYSINELAMNIGFTNCVIQSHNSSQIPNFVKYDLDSFNGISRKPDSLYFEAAKP